MRTSQSPGFAGCTDDASSGASIRRHDMLRPRTGSLCPGCGDKAFTLRLVARSASTSPSWSGDASALVVAPMLESSEAH